MNANATNTALISDLQAALQLIPIVSLAYGLLQATITKVKAIDDAGGTVTDADWSAINDETKGLIDDIHAGVAADAAAHPNG